MGTAFSLVLFALGAVLAFAVRSEPDGLDITAVGVIIMLVSAIHFGWTVYREQWRRRMVEESVEGGQPMPPMPVDDTVLVDPTVPFEAPRHIDVVPGDDGRYHDGRYHDAQVAQPAVHVNVESGERAR